MSLRQASDAVVMCLMSASIAATAVITAVTSDQSAHGGGETGDPCAFFESLLDEGGGKSSRRPEYERPTARPRT